MTRRQGFALVSQLDLLWQRCTPQLVDPDAARLPLARVSEAVQAVCDNFQAESLGATVLKML